jgi:hypothetical protein
MGKPHRDVIIGQLRMLAKGLAKYPPSQPMNLEQVEYDAAAIIQRIQVSIAAEVDVQRKAAALHASVAKCAEIRESEAEFLSAVKLLTLLRLKKNLPALAEHGLSPPKPNPKRTTEQRLLMTAKNHATRKKRGTLSKKQKKAIKGDVTGVTVTPVVRRDDE